MTVTIPATACVAAPRRDSDGETRRGITPRTHRLAMDAVTREYLPFAEWARLSAAYTPEEGIDPFLAAAHVFAYIHPRLTPVIRADELLVGARIRALCAERQQSNWFPDGYAFYLDLFARNAPPDRPDIQTMAARGLISPQGSFNHKVVDYAGFLRTGSAALARRAREMAETKTGAEHDMLLGFALGHEAMIAHAQTYADACETLADSAAPERTVELREIARICRKVPAHPADTFHEALQSLWFAYMVAGDGTGRVDVYLNDFYQADLAAGRITPERAQELIECFLIKLHGDTFEGVINVSSIQTMTLGGLLPDGADATNALTRLFLAAVRNVRLLRPTVYIRCHAQTPEDVLELAVAMLGEGVAEPSFYGDPPILTGLTRIGVPLEIARDYALSGCTEVVSPGRGNWGAPNGWINLALLVDEAIRTHAAAGAPTAEALWIAITAKINDVAEVCRVANIHVDAHPGVRYEPTLLMPACLERGKDVGHGGLETHYGHWEAIGLPNAAEMLFAAEQLAYREGASLPELLACLDREDPALLAQLHRLPRFGNDDAGVDEVAARLIQLLADALECRSTPFRTALVLGHLAGGENMHIVYGEKMGATLDGRKAGQTLADSLAGAQGKTTAGPTAVIRSLCRLDHSRMVAGNVSTLRLHPSDFATPDSRTRVVGLIRAFVAMGGSQLQINVVDAQTLRNAQADPASYRGLLVRIAGYSADFTNIGKKLQDEVIARLEGIVQ